MQSSSQFAEELVNISNLQKIPKFVSFSCTNRDLIQELLLPTVYMTGEHFK